MQKEKRSVFAEIAAQFKTDVQRHCGAVVAAKAEGTHLTISGVPFAYLQALLPQYPGAQLIQSGSSYSLSFEESGLSFTLQEKL